MATLRLGLLVLVLVGSLYGDYGCATNADNFEVRTLKSIRISTDKNGVKHKETVYRQTRVIDYNKYTLCLDKWVNS